MEMIERQRLAVWVDRDGEGEAVLWLDRDPDGTFYLCDWNDCVAVDEADIDAEVEAWDEATADPEIGTGHLVRRDWS